MKILTVPDLDSRVSLLALSKVPGHLDTPRTEPVSDGIGPRLGKTGTNCDPELPYETDRAGLDFG